jgi:hypothetical protein
MPSGESESQFAFDREVRPEIDAIVSALVWGSGKVDASETTGNRLRLIRNRERQPDMDRTSITQ